MKHHIEVCVKDGQTNTQKGQILENLLAEIMSIMQYDITKTVRITGMEVDILAKHKVTGSVIFAECKAWTDNLPADSISKLLGNVMIQGADCGWLVTTGGLSKDAEGTRTEWENRHSSERTKLAFYTADRILDLLITSNTIKDYSAICEENSTFKYASTGTLMIIDEGKYWIAPIKDNHTEFTSSVAIYNACTGVRISDVTSLERLKQYKNSFSENYQWVGEDPITQKGNIVTKLEDEYNNIATVISGDDWNDYRPARPEDFVGRKDIIEAIMSFLKSVTENNSNTRVFALKAPSGMGKSSVVLKIADLSKKRSNSKHIFVHAVDVRTALSARYVEMALKSCFDAADKAGFTDRKSRNFDFHSVTQYLNSDSLSDTFAFLKNNDKTIVLIFDQFEEVFAKKELYGMFDIFRQLINAVDSLQENFVLGFAWKTDLILPSDHPAYYMWSELADRRREFELQQFKPNEISTAINIFGKQLGEKVNPKLNKYLVKQCQGYPWLLKKLCIHVFNEIQSGHSQDSVIGEKLNIVNIFESDLSGLSPEEDACVKEIAIHTPADYFTITESFGQNIITTLINKRIVIRRASKLILYWDIFRDYVLNKTIPALITDYIPIQQYATVSKVVLSLLTQESLEMEKVSELVGLSTTTLDNVMVDLVMFGIAKRENKCITLTIQTECEIVTAIQNFFKSHIMYIELQQLGKRSFDYVTFSDIFEKIYQNINVNEKNKAIYCSKLYNWLVRLGLIEEDGALCSINGNKLLPTTLNPTGKVKRRGRHRVGGQCLFWGQSSPRKLQPMLESLSQGNNSYSKLKNLGYKNTLEDLMALGVICKRGDLIFIEETIETIYSLIQTSETMLFTKSKVFENKTITAEELGAMLNQEFSRNWSLGSKQRYGGALLRWCKYLKFKEFPAETIKT